MMKTKILAFEYLTAIFFALQVLLPNRLNWVISAGTFLFIMLLKYKYEGLRLTFLFYILIQTGLLLFSHSIIDITLMLLAYCVLNYFPIFEFPETKGPFHVGFKDLIFSKNLQVSVFYPTLQKTRKVLYKTTEDGWVRIYDIMRSYPGHFIPKFIYKIAFSFLDYLDIGVNLNAKIISPQHLSHDEQKFPAIVFSHGLSANRNLYTGFARQWASYGYIVFCIDHDEPIYLEFKNWEDYRKHRNVHLYERGKTMRQVIDFISDPLEVKKFFQNSTIEVDYKRISLAGHSFGSAAVAHYAASDSRVTGALVLLDPWLYPADDQVLEIPAKKPVLVIRSESFNNVFEEFKAKERIQRYIEANKEHKDQTLSCHFENSTHNSFCDLIVHMPREMELFGIIKKPKDVEEIYNCQTMLSQIFLDLTLYSNVVFDVETKKSKVLKAFNSYFNNNTSGKNRMQIDDF